MPSNLIRILLVDDHQMLREGLRILINGEEEMAVVGEAASGEEALALMYDLNPDVVIMDLGLPGIGGLAAIKAIRDSSHECKIVVLTMHGEKAMISQSFKAGANGFVPKSTAHTHLLEAIRTVYAGERYLDPDAAVSMVEEVTDRFEKAMLLRDLSEREAEVFTLTAMGYTRTEISEQLAISPKTVDTYRLRSMDKLGLENRADMVRFALQAGIMTNDE